MKPFLPLPLTLLYYLLWLKLWGTEFPWPPLTLWRYWSSELTMPGPSLKMLKPQHCSLKGKEILNINTVPLINPYYITLQSNKLAQILFHKLGGEFYSFCIFQVHCYNLFFFFKEKQLISKNWLKTQQRKKNINWIHPKFHHHSG